MVYILLKLENHFYHTLQVGTKLWTPKLGGA